MISQAHIAINYRGQDHECKFFEENFCSRIFRGRSTFFNKKSDVTRLVLQIIMLFFSFKKQVCLCCVIIIGIFCSLRSLGLSNIINRVLARHFCFSNLGVLDEGDRLVGR